MAHSTRRSPRQRRAGAAIGHHPAPFGRTFTLVEPTRDHHWDIVRDYRHWWIILLTVSLSAFLIGALLSMLTH